MTETPGTFHPHTALLLIAHGSRYEEANADLHCLVAQLREKGRYEVIEASFLELAEPGIVEGARRCVAQGATHVILLPYFLSAGVHVLRDLSEACRLLALQHPFIKFRLAEPLGRHPLLLELVMQR